MSAKACVLEFGMGVDVHGADSTKAASAAVGVPDPASVSVDLVRRELPHGEVTVRPVPGGLRVPGADTLIACAAITVSVDYPARNAAEPFGGPR